MDATESALAALRNKKILILEDEVLIGMDLVDTFEDAGLDVLPLARSVEEGLKMAASEAIDVALLDVSLPDGSGFEVGRVLEDRGIPFAFHSGHVTRSEAQADFPDAGWIAKPAEPDDLIRTVGRLVEDDVSM